MVSNRGARYRPFYVELRGQIFDLRAAVTNAVVSLESKFKKYRCTIESVGLDDEIPARGYMIQIEQVIVNMLNNAIAAVESIERKKIKIELKVIEKSKLVELNVSDSGGGVPAGDVPRIFEPYFTTKDAGKGTGIGLYISKTIIEIHGGMLYYRKAFGSDTVFGFRLPLSQK